eukprot:TRINITY_DN16813_c0_g1_i1.p1 TRINITY_DN16813_c0_g1~~TRINITY_DN16813_c0_g1_i1.p1  ORF type:complete len:140 (+),score=29.41 TRINITY_DN16813_c0_g1_i1:73-492(+)
MSLHLDNETELNPTKNKLFTQPKGSIVLYYVGPDTVHLDGSTEFQVLTDRFQDDQIVYGLVRLQNKDDEGDIRNVFVKWFGSKIGADESELKKTHLFAASQFLQPFHGEVTVDNKSHFQEQTLWDLAFSTPPTTSHHLE